MLHPYINKTVHSTEETSSQFVKTSSSYARRVCSVRACPVAHPYGSTPVSVHLRRLFRPPELVADLMSLCTSLCARLFEGASTGALSREFGLGGYV